MSEPLNHTTSSPTDNSDELCPTQTVEGIRDFFPYLYKLYMVANRRNHPFIRWSNCGEMVEFEYITVQDYLLSSCSIFIERDITDFIEQLHNYKFERLEMETKPEDGIWLQYRHQYFQRQRLDLVAKIKGQHCKLLYDLQMAEKLSTEVNGDEEPQDIQVNVAVGYDLSNKNATATDNVIGAESEQHNRRQHGRNDDCVKQKGHLTPLQLARLRVDMVLGFHQERQKLSAKTDPVEVTALPQHMQTRRSRTKVVQDPVIELPADKFENPVDSMMQLAEGFDPGYAGYFGGASSDLVYRFFGEYMPRYNDTKSEIITDVKIRDSPVRNREQLDGFSDECEEDVIYEVSLDDVARSLQKKLNKSNNAKESVPIMPPDEQMDVDDYEQVITSLVGDEEDIEPEPEKEEGATTNILYEMNTNNDNRIVTVPNEDYKKTDSEEFPDEVFNIYMEQVSGDEEVKDPSTQVNETINFSTICDEYRNSLNLLLDDDSNT